VYSTEVNRFTKCTSIYLFISYHCLDANLLKIIRTSLLFVNRFANVTLVCQKYFFKNFPHTEVFKILWRVRVSLDGVSYWIPDLLTTYGSPPQPTITVPLDKTFQISMKPQHKSESSMSTRRFLVIDFNTIIIALSLNSTLQISLQPQHT
jgi:hypothetical protein